MEVRTFGGTAKYSKGNSSIFLERYCTLENAKSPPGDDKFTAESSKGKHFQIVVKVTTAGFHSLSFMMPLLITLIMKCDSYCVVLD